MDMKLSSEINTNDSFESGESDISKDDLSFGYGGKLERTETNEIFR